MHSHEHERTSPSLPTIEQVCERTTLGRTSIYERLREDETFPKPVRPTKRSVRWRASDIDNWIAALPSADSAPARRAVRRKR